jgi:S-adenosylmethionine hydrolase
MSDPFPVVTFLSDFGTADEFVGVCHGVILTRCPAARVIDITHSVPPQDVRVGAFLLAAALPYMPAGVHLAVVDPGVGMDVPGGRRAVALRTEDAGRQLVGPDNGLLVPAAGRFGGVREAVDIGGSPARLARVSATFHGRDIFSPVAAALAAGERLRSLGDPIDPATLASIPLLAAEVRGASVLAQILHADHFGNLTLDATPEQLVRAGGRPGEGEVEVLCRDRTVRAAHRTTFGEVARGELLLHEDSRGLLALAVNRGSAATLLGARPGEGIELRVP